MTTESGRTLISGLRLQLGLVTIPVDAGCINK